jgi:hypothetical protein
MPVNIECPCGHSVRIPDEMANTRVKCPVCGELLTPPREQAAADPFESPGRSVVESSKPVSAPPTPGSDPIDQPLPVQPQAIQMRKVTHLEGSSAFLLAGLPIPSFFSRSALTLLPERVRLKSSGLFTTRRVDLRLSAITSGENRRCPGWYLLVPGILLLPTNGVGVVFLIAFLFVRHSFVILRSDTTSVAVRIKGDDSDACAVLDAVLQAANRASQQIDVNGGRLEGVD